jgi:hypothetical protein
MRKRVLSALGWLVIDGLVALVLLLVYFQGRYGLVLLNQGVGRPIWHNVTPGQADTIPELFLTRYSPWPLPARENYGAVAGIALKPGQPIILRGTANQVRFWSFIFYPGDAKNHTSEMPGIDSVQVQLEPDGTYEIGFGPEPVGRNWVNTGTATAGMLFMRNYVPASLSAPLHFPAIYQGNVLLTPAEVRHYAP